MSSPLGHRPRKRFGQNFLVDNNVIDRIIHSINPQPDDHVVEIGPGLGALTQPLLHTLARLDVIEIDRDVIPKLKSIDGSERLHIHNIDVLSFDFTSFTEANFQREKLRIIGNLPYNISTAVLFHLVNHRSIIKDLHFMLQKEVVERIAASVGSHDFGRLSVMMQLHFNITPLFTVSPQCFRPVPRVESAIIRLQTKTECPVSAAEHADFESLVKQAFSQRRKTLRNTLKNFCTVAQMEAAGIDPGKRPQELGVNDYLALFRQLQ